MPELTTQKITTHTLTLTDDELIALREAGAMAIKHDNESKHVKAWRSFAHLGKPTRGAGGPFGETPPTRMAGRGA
ncbi:hypothetical protein [Streptomyces sp. NPDC058612]|uniref:hypothetical protein n=1 Tax=Streptomyces sp. NPDC058612 TaxID=3346555 RepID=UPI00364B63F2